MCAKKPELLRAEKLPNGNIGGLDCHSSYRCYACGDCTKWQGEKFPSGCPHFKGTLVIDNVFYVICFPSDNTEKNACIGHYLDDTKSVKN